MLQKIQSLPVFTPPAPRQVVWWLLKEKKLLTPEQQDFRLELSQVSPAITQGQKLVQEFRSLLRARNEAGYDQWREKVKNSELKELQSFAQGLLKDEAAVRAAFTSEWSNGQVEGQGATRSRVNSCCDKQAWIQPDVLPSVSYWSVRCW